MRPDEIDPPKPHDPPWRSRHAHRSLDPAVAEMLREARVGRGWSQVQAGRELGVARRMIGMLEAGQRVPSTVMADVLIDGYDLDGPEAELLRSAALHNVGRDSPCRDVDR